MSNPPFSLPFDPVALLAETRERFGMSDADVERAMSGLMPAFWAGVRHSAGTPGGLQALMAAFSPQGYPGFGAPGLGSGAGTFPGGEALVGLLFPNEQIRRAVLDQVAASTGLGRDALSEMMPVAATMMMASQARNFAVGPARDWLDAFMAGYARGRPKPPPTAAEMMAPFADAMNAFFAGFTGTADAEDDAAAPQRRGRAPAAEEPLDEQPDAAEDAADGPAEPGAPEGSVLQDFFAASRGIQESQVRAFEKLFETFAPGKAG